MLVFLNDPNLQKITLILTILLILPFFHHLLVDFLLNYVITQDVYKFCEIFSYSSTQKHYALIRPVHPISLRLQSSHFCLAHPPAYLL